MGIYGSFIMIQISKKINHIPSLVSMKIFKTFSKYSYELYLFSDPFNCPLIRLLYICMGVQLLSNTGAAISFVVRFVGTILLAFVVIWFKNKVSIHFSALAFGK